MAKEYVPVYFDWLEVTQDLSAEEKGNLIDAVVSYAAGETYDHLLSGGCRIAFRFMKGQVDRNSALSEARAKAASGRKETAETSDSPEQSEANRSKTEQTETNSIKEEKKEEKKEKEIKIYKKENKRGIPPSPEEVADYCRERGNSINPQQFLDFYEAKGWKIGNQPMKDWKAAIRTWEQRDSRPVSSSSGRPVRRNSRYEEDPEAIKRQEEQLKRMAEAVGINLYDTS